MMDPLILAVDIGTSSLKAAIIDCTGNLHGSSRVRFPVDEARTPAHWLQALKRAIGLLVPSRTITAMAISGNGPTLVSVAPDDSAKILLWNDDIPENPERLQKGPSLFIPRMLAFRARWPSIYDAAVHLLSGPEYLVWLLTGTAATVLPDPRYEAVYWRTEDLAIEGLRSDFLAPFVPPGESAGPVLPALAAELGLKHPVPVYQAGPDFTSALIGTATLTPGTACDRAGTSEGLNVCIDRQLAVPFLRTLPALEPGLWNLSWLVPDSGSTFNRWRRDSGQSGRSYPEIMAEIASTPVIPPPGTPDHNGRLVAEATALNLREGIKHITGATGREHSFVLSGGQARNDIWNQMKADITGAVFQLTTTPDGELMGNAILSARSLGIYSSLTEAAEAMVRITRVWEPDLRNHALYLEKYGTP